MVPEKLKQNQKINAKFSILYKLLGISTFIFLICVITPSFGQENVLQLLEKEFKKIVTTARPVVVKVIASQNTPAQLPPDIRKIFPSENISSGIILDKEGHIATTTFDMVPSKIEVVFNNNKKVPAKIIGMDDLTDLVVLKTDNKLPMQVKKGDSDKIGMGSWVFTIGSSQGEHPIISFGIVSGRETLPAHPCAELIKINVPVSPGNSGGAIVNTSGEIVGMILAVLTEPNEFNPLQLPMQMWNSQNITFAVPIETVKSVATKIIKHGKVPRGWLGVDIEISNFGVFVTRVVKNSPAHKSGLLPRDIILEFNNAPVKNYTELRRRVGTASPNTEVILKIHRNGSEQNYTIKLGER
ncbi:PDZ domain-containing protein [Candidatus Poribacteria bacterium]|nr:PDZ domain-containing protein [Candidatus Poribacteria bacterium]